MDGGTAIVATRGNPDCHVILRGSTTPNFDAASVQAASEVLGKAHLPARLMIDASRANSGKRSENQPRVVEVMIESHLLGGRQERVVGQPLAYGQSITDGCIGWDGTVQVLARLAEAVRLRRRTQLEAAA